MKLFTEAFAFYKDKTVLSVSAMLMFCCSVIIGCTSNKQLAHVGGEKTLLTEDSAGWLKYKVYLLPTNAEKSGQTDYMQLSIMVINMADNTSPLRRICTNLDNYNTYYEYLLNRCKDDLNLLVQGTILYPISYSFENNYNAFPFETINVGYKYDLRNKRNRHIKDLKLRYADRVFAHDTITFYLNNKK